MEQEEIAAPPEVEEEEDIQTSPIEEPAPEQSTEPMAEPTQAPVSSGPPPSPSRLSLDPSLIVNVIPAGITKVEVDDPVGDNGNLGIDHAYFMMGYDDFHVYVAIELYAPGDLNRTRVYSDREVTGFGYQFQIFSGDDGYSVSVSTDEGTAGYYKNHMGSGEVIGSSDDFIVFSVPREFIPNLKNHYFWLVSGLGKDMDKTPGEGSKGPWLRFDK